MKTEVFYCIPTYKSFQECRESILAAREGTLVPDAFVIVDNSSRGAILPYVQDIPNVVIWPQTTNIGVAAAWNMFQYTLMRDYIIIANDDIKVHTHTIENLVTAAKQSNDVFFAGAGAGHNMFSLFLLKYEAYLDIGPFDEKFYPAYYEDNDYARRLVLAGKRLMTLDNVTYDHAGSSTISKYTQAEKDAHHNDFRRNTEYYRRKWGGLPGKETYEKAFNKD